MNIHIREWNTLDSGVARSTQFRMPNQGLY
jgi:hypothetical protein